MSSEAINHRIIARTIIQDWEAFKNLMNLRPIDEVGAILGHPNQSEQLRDIIWQAQKDYAVVIVRPVTA